MALACIDHLFAGPNDPTMSSSQVARADVVIIGAGIAGLWLAHRLERAGRSVVLLESHRIGGGQTVASQGIIHGGTKYALTNRLTGASEAIRAMPARWKEAIAGKGEIDLSKVKVLSACQHLWSQESLPSRMTTFFAASVMKNRVRSLPRAQFPLLLAPREFRGSVYEIDEMVLDVHSLLAQLARLSRARVLKVDGDSTSFNAPSPASCGAELLIRCTPQGGDRSVRFAAGAVVCTAGGGSEGLWRRAGADAAPFPRRPLHMILARGPIEHPLFGHCLGAGPRPRLTVTSHQWEDDPRRRVWYLGGELAETGVNRSRMEQINAARREIETLFPWVDAAAWQWDAFMIDRVEGLQGHHARPDRPVIQQVGPVLFAWPTKLAFAPLLADELMARIDQLVPRPSPGDFEAILDWPQPEVAAPPWKEARPWHTFDR